MSVTRLVCATAFTVLMLTGCSPEPDRRCTAANTDLMSDPLNCGTCDNVCDESSACVAGRCLVGACQPGAIEECYSGPESSLNVGTCVGGTRKCGPSGVWGMCEGEITPLTENCSDGLDNDCNGMVDDNQDGDGDGFSTCGIPGVIRADCCDNVAICDKPELVNGGAFDAAGNNFDDDCNGIVDDTILLCDTGLNSNSTSAMDFAKAIDICQTASDLDTRWGVIEGKITHTDGTGTPDKEAYAIRPRFGNGVIPQGGVSLAMISSGGAAAKNDTNPAYHPWVSYTHAGTNVSTYPADWFAANGMELPNAPGCPPPNNGGANDPVMVTFRIRVPTNARSFQLSTNFFSSEFPEYTCTAFNDFFVVLLDSQYSGPNPNPTDKNLAFYQPMGTMEKYPVGVNLAFGNTGLFTQCVNGGTGCSGSVPGTINTCAGIEHLVGTGFDDPASSCGGSNLTGGATGWLVTYGNVKPGEVITLRIAIWDTSDHQFDSAAIFDGFAWSTELANPGTVIF